MKLNLECIRATLFYLEENLTITSELVHEEISVLELRKHLQYPIEELANTVLVLSEAGFIEIVTEYADDQITILDVYRITYDGYQFIESIRPEPVWKKILSVGCKVGSFSISTIMQIATSVISSMITAQLTGVPNP